MQRTNYVSATCIKMDGIRLAKGPFDLASPILILPLPVSAKSRFMSFVLLADNPRRMRQSLFYYDLSIGFADGHRASRFELKKKKANQTALMIIIESMLMYQHCSDHMMYSDMERSTSNSSPASRRVITITVLIDPVPFPLSFSQFQLPEYVADVIHAMVFHSCFSPV
ncbi:hypothetical protein D5086_016401 [Populus alba]|uniref:Uncharacterized protein n=1 Tax=Populus alba TaxID=43335 RepID=A0ACC4BVC1_POPAL